MGNCAGSPKTNEGEEVPVPAPVLVEEVVNVDEQQENKVEDNAPPQDTKNDEGTKVEEESKGEEVKEEKKAEKEESKAEETKEEKAAPLI